MSRIATIALLLLAAFLLGCVLSPSFLSCGKRHVPPAQNINLNKMDSAKYWKDSLGREHALFQQHILSTKAEQIQFQDSIAELARVRGIKPKQAEGYTKLAEVTTQAATGIVHRDSATGSQTFEHHSEYWNFSAFIDSLGRYKLHDTMYATIDMLPYWEPKYKWLGKWGGVYHYNDISSDNPSVKITGSTTYRVKIKERRLGLGLFVGVNTTLQPVFGGGLIYRIF